MGERGVAAHRRARDPQHVRLGARLARAGRGRGRRLGAARKAEAVHLADHRVAGDAAELCGDLAGRQDRRPTASSASRRARRSKSCVNFLGSRRGGEVRTESTRVWATTGWPDAYARYRFTLDCPPHEMSYLTIEKLQYGENRAQESDCSLPHVPSTSTPCVHTYLQTVCSASTFTDASPDGRHRIRHVDSRRAAIEYRFVPPGEAAHFISD